MVNQDKGAKNVEEHFEENISQDPEKKKDCEEIKHEEPLKLPKLSQFNFESFPLSMAHPHSTSNGSAFLQNSQIFPCVFPAFSNSAMPAFNQYRNASIVPDNSSGYHYPRNAFLEEHCISFGGFFHLDIAKKISADFMRRNSNIYPCLKGNEG